MTWQVGGDPNEARRTSSSSWCIHRRGVLIPRRDSPSLPLPLSLHLTSLHSTTLNYHSTPSLLIPHFTPTVPQSSSALLLFSHAPSLRKLTRKSIKQDRTSSFESVESWVTCFYCNIISYLNSRDFGGQAIGVWCSCVDECWYILR